MELIDSRGILYVIGDFLSLITILSCLVSKIPQIQIIRNNKSAQGISLNGLLMEFCSYTVTMLYNYTNGYAIMTYMEYPILLIQEYVLVYYVLKYKDLINQKSFIWIGVYWSLFFSLVFGIIPGSVLLYLIPFTTPVGVTSKLMQLFEILRTKDAQSVSLTTWGLSAFTNATRIYTILIDSGDRMLLANFSISTFAGLSVFLAAWHYKKPKYDKVE